MTCCTLLEHCAKILGMFYHVVLFETVLYVYWLVLVGVVCMQSLANKLNRKTGNHQKNIAK